MFGMILVVVGNYVVSKFIVGLHSNLGVSKSKL